MPKKTWGKISTVHRKTDRYLVHMKRPTDSATETIWFYGSELINDPQEIVKWRLDTVLDPFVGSGTTAVAATKEGANVVGIELNEEYVAIAKERLNHEQKGRT